jgi:hypothetical protein
LLEKSPIFVQYSRVNPIKNGSGEEISVIDADSRFESNSIVFRILLPKSSGLMHNCYSTNNLHICRNEMDNKYKIICRVNVMLGFIVDVLMITLAEIKGSGAITKKHIKRM